MIVTGAAESLGFFKATDTNNTEQKCEFIHAAGLVQHDLNASWLKLAAGATHFLDIHLFDEIPVLLRQIPLQIYIKHWKSLWHNIQIINII